ncbi:MAG: aminotransferase class I/II-fold pyridoxal phosphate-dependent enzyme [Elusimicrobiota bacterium]|nr:aminotransferase class I/II-fold pyridoxal phosphate-dependent enzyme [Elusimicrobiota bacterium]
MAGEFKKRRDYVYEELNSVSGIKVTRPRGAFYIFPDIREFLSGDMGSSRKFAQELLKEKLVALVPGEGFGAEGFARISYALSMEELSKGLGRIREFLE